MILDFLFDFKKASLNKAEALVEKINQKENEISILSDQKLKEQSLQLKNKVSKGENPDDVLIDAFALIREASKRTLGQRHFDVQLLGGIVLHQGKIAEMLTGEGKTLAATTPAYLNALTGKGVHIITVNDYLAKRDTVWMGQIYHFLGLSVGCLTHEQAFLYDPNYQEKDPEPEILVTEGAPKKSKLEITDNNKDKERDVLGGFKVVREFLRPVSRKEAYLADITYGTNHEFGFDYLRDNLVYNKSDQVLSRDFDEQSVQDIEKPTIYSDEQKTQDIKRYAARYNYAIIDEVDSILIDEARTPLIIASPDYSSAEFYKLFNKAVSRLKVEEDYIVDEKHKSAEITEKGIDAVEKLTGIKNLYSPQNIGLIHFLEACLKANYLFVKDKDYVIKSGEVVIVDQFTGRLMFGRRYSAGLHQAIEAKEMVQIKEESKTFAQITIQNFFRLYKKKAGMTGTAQTSAEEFHKVYNLEVVSIPPNKPMIRKDFGDVVYKTAQAKYQAISEEIKKRQEAGQPVLVGTVSIEKNEALADYFRQTGISFEILNAKNHEREGSIIAQAGKLGAVTLATNMAGRGVDIVLGGNPSSISESEKIKEIGGLHVIGTERHEARRIDNQLRGRAGRQGDLGSSQFFLSLEDDLMRVFGGDRLKQLMHSFNIPDEQPIESRLVSSAIAEAQRKIEGINFDTRKHLLEYDDVLNKQRINIYRRRQEVLDADEKSLKNIVANLISDYLKKINDSDKFDEIREKINRFENISIIKRPVLMILDTLWMNHLEDIESLTDSVRIRAYGQHDPLVEYRRESHILFNELILNLERWVFENIFKIRSLLENSSENLQVKTSNFFKAGRNDPCPCGAKKEDGTPIKYKKCHGK